MCICCWWCAGFRYCGSLLVASGTDVVSLQCKGQSYVMGMHKTGRLHSGYNAGKSTQSVITSRLAWFSSEGSRALLAVLCAYKKSILKNGAGNMIIFQQNTSSQQEQGSQSQLMTRDSTTVIGKCKCILYVTHLFTFYRFHIQDRWYEHMRTFSDICT